MSLSKKKKKKKQKKTKKKKRDHVGRRERNRSRAEGNRCLCEKGRCGGGVVGSEDSGKLPDQFRGRGGGHKKKDSWI